MNIHFITFADGNDNLRAAALRITMQAAETGWFTSWRSYHAEDLYRLSPQWSASHKTFIQSNPRGFGYWIWKPLIIAETLKTIPPGDILVYVDAGYEISIQGGARFNEYIELTKEYDLLVFEINEPIYKWTKGDILSYFGIQGRKEILTANQTAAGLVIVKNTTSNILFMNIWTECATARNYSLVDDQPSVFPNIDGFSENRHDQAIFTILLKLFRKAFTLPAEDYFHELFQKGQYIPALPFHAFRNKSGVRLIRLDTPNVPHG